MTLNFSLSGTYGNGAPFASQGFNGSSNPGNYEVRMSGAINLATTGVYTFGTTSDDGSMLWIDGNPVVNNNFYQGFTRRTGTITITTPGLHNIAVAYYQGGGGNGLLVDYTPPGGAVTAVPNNILAPTVSNTTYGNTVNMSASSTLDIQGTQLADMGPLTISAAGQTLNVTGDGLLGQYVGALRFPSVALAGGAGSYGFNVGSGELVVSSLSDGGTAATITKSGPGYLTLTGTAAGFTAGTNFQVSGGTLLAVGQNLASGPLASAPVTLNNGAILLAATSSAGQTFAVDSTGNVLTMAGSSNDTIAAGTAAPTTLGPAQAATPAVSSGTVTLSGAGLSVPAGTTLNLAAINGYTLAVSPTLSLATSGTISAGPGSVTLLASNFSGSAGTLSASTGGTLVLPNSMAGINALYAPAITGTVQFTGNFSGLAASLQPAVGGTILLSTSTSISGGTINVAGGAFAAGNANSFGTAALELNGGTLAATATLTGTNAVANPLAWGPTPTLYIGGGSNLQLSSSLVLATSGTTYYLNDPNTHLTLSGAISGPGALNVTGFPTFTNTNTYSGGTTFNGATGVSINNNSAFGSGPFTFNNGGFQSTVALTGSNAVANNYSWTNNQGLYINAGQAVELSGSATIPSGTTGNIEVAPNTTLTLSGNISGGGTLHKANYNAVNNAGTLVLTGTNSGFSGTLVLDQFSEYTYFGNNGALGSGTLNLGTGNIELYAGTPTVGANVVLPNSLVLNASGFGVHSDGNGGNLSFSGNVTLAGTTNSSIYSYGTGTKAVTFSGPISGTQGFAVYGFNGNGNVQPVLLTNPANSYTGVTSAVFGTFIAGANVPASGAGAFGNPSAGTASIIQIGDTTAGQGGTYAEGAGILAENGVSIARPINIRAGNTGTATLGGYDNSNLVFSGSITLNKSLTRMALS